MEMYAVYLESLDQELLVFEDKAKAQKYYDELQAQNKPVKMEVFGDWQLSKFEKSTWCGEEDPEHFEEIQYNNGNYVLIARYCWHKSPQKEGYYADYEIAIP